jgi:cation:H+ antiporter
MLLSFIGFFFAAALVFFAGKRLSFYGDLLAEHTGMGKAWTGLILMSAVTSLPELMVGVSSSALLQSPDLAVGDIMGSCAFNLCILAIMDIATPRNRPFFGAASKTQVIAGLFGMILLSLVGLGLFLPEDILLIPYVGITTLSFGAIYFISIRTIYTYQSMVPAAVQEEHNTLNTLHFRTIVGRYTLFALVIVLSALTLPYFAEKIALESRLSSSFMGTLFLAVSTSLPEIAVSLSAVRRGSVDLAIGNLLGSNLFNIFILMLDDLVYIKGDLLKDASDSHLISVFFVLMMSAVALIGFLFPSREKRAILSLTSFILLFLWVLNLGLLLTYKG